MDPSYSTLQAKVRATARTGATVVTATSDSLFLIQTPASVEVDAASPRPTFALSRNVPNPFNPRTTIRFELAEPGHARLRIYSAQGGLVRTLVDERLPAGGFHVSWDGKDSHGLAAASGVYFYKLEEGKNTLTRKMSLLK